MSFICEKCNKSFSTKYTLKTHKDTQICNNKTETCCLSSKCDYKSIKNSDLQKHIKICKYVEIDRIHQQYSKTIDRLQTEHNREIVHLQTEHTKEMDQLRVEHLQDILHIKEAHAEQSQERMTSLLEKAISRPNVTHTTNTNIRGNNNNLQNILAPKELYERQVDPDRIKSIDHSVVEKHFWLGQKGMARFCVDHIAKTIDENGNSKLLLCCTDPSRKRFKYVDGNNEVVDDIDARHFIDTVSPPIVKACREVYDDVVKRIETDRHKTKDAFDLNLLDNRENVAQRKFLEINDIGDHTRNTEYKSEMTILLKK
jgi:hypothetical protein